MQVIVEGHRGDTRYTYTYDLLDRYDTVSGTTSMARTTGYTAAIVARQVAQGLYTWKGISPPEYLGGLASCYEHLMAEYAKRGIHVSEEITVGQTDV
jgi:saccharopine dehydrogenase-like NADP-dependent oxidoreductase